MLTMINEQGSPDELAYWQRDPGIALPASLKIQWQQTSILLRLLFVLLSSTLLRQIVFIHGNFRIVWHGFNIIGLGCHNRDPHWKQVS
jgi:hypothetical protein